MFCPKCGTSEQSPNSYCRRCGNFLPDFDKLKPVETPPEQHLTANTWLSAMTAGVALPLGIALYAIFLRRPDTHWIIYLTAGFLVAMSAWQIQVFIRTLKLKKHLKSRRNNVVDSTSEKAELKERSSPESLPAGDFDNVVPFSVTSKTTKKLKTPRS